MSRRTMNFLLPTPGAGLNKKRKRFDDDVDYDGNGDGDGDGNDHAVHAVHDDHVRQSAAAAGAAGAAGAPTAKTNGDRLSPNNSKADADDANPNDDDDDDDGEAASFDPPPMEPQQQQQQQEEEGAMVVSDATSRLIEAMQFQIHTLTEKVARLDSLERRCRYLEEHCTCRTGGNGASRDDDDYGGGGSTAGNADAAEVPTLALLKSMEIPLNNLRQATDGIPSLERRYDDLEDLRRGMRGGDDRHPDYDRHHHNHHHHHHHHLRLQSLEERCRFLEAKLHAHAHALADVPSTIPPPSGKRPEDAATDADILFALLPDASPSDRPRPSALYDLDIVRAREEAVLLTIDTYKRRKRWPLRRNKADIFERDEKLTRLRLFESRRLRHEKVKFDKARDEGKEEEEEEEVEEEQEDQEQDQDQGQDQDEGDEEKKGGETTEGKNQMENKTRMSCKKNKNDSIDGETSNNTNVNVNVHINADILKFKSKSKSKSNEPKEKVNKQGIKSCALCASPKCSRKVRWKCGLCQVPLCTKKNKNGSKSCWEIWHTEMDWREERRRVQKELVEKRAKKRGVGRGRGGGVVENRGGDGEDDSDGEEEEEEEEDEVEEKGVEGGKEKENGRDGESVVHV